MDSNEWDTRYSTAEYIWNAGPNQFVAAQFDGAPAAGTAIDLAAGEGRNAVWLAEQGWTATAVDFSRVALEKANHLASDRGVSIRTVVADVTSWEPAEPVDLVVIAYLQLPSKVQVSVLEHAKTWVKPGGTLFLIAHDRNNVENGYGGPPSEEVCYDLDRTVAALAGLEIEQAEVAERHVETADGEQVALDTLVVAHAPQT